MFDKLLTLHCLDLITNSLEEILKRSTKINCADDFLLSDGGMILLDSICMKLIAIGESVKNIDKTTNKELLVNYPEIPWKNVMGIRDIIVHHYFDVDADEIFRICKEDIPQLYDVIDKIRKEL